MSDVPFQHPGSVPPRPEVPEGVIPGPPPPPPQPSTARDLAAFAWWAPFPAALVAMLFAVVVTGLIGVVYEATGGNVSDEPPGLLIGGTYALDLALIAAAVLFAGIGGVRPTAAAFGLRRTHFWRAVGLAALAAAAFYVFSFVWTIALDVKESDDLPGKLGAKDSTLSFVAVAIMVCVAAPLAEEFFFRGFCFPAFANVIGWLGSAVVVGMVFGAIHLGGTKAVFLVPLAVFGFLLCLLYRFSGSLLPCIALHAVNNAVAFGIGVDWTWQVPILVLAAVGTCFAVTLGASRVWRGAPA